MKRIIVQMPGEVLEEMDDAASERSESRSAFVRRAIDSLLAERRRIRELEKVRRSFQDMPQEGPVASRSKIRRAWPD